MQARKESRNMGVMEPHERLRSLTNYCNSVEIDPSVPPRRYYRSGLEMVRMANVYLEEGCLESAYVLYMKFMTLFIEKIRKHPEYTTVPATEKANNQLKLREVLPKAEKIKVLLLDQFTKEYNRHLAEVQQQEKQEQERRRRDTEKRDRKKNQLITPAQIEQWANSNSTVVQPIENLDEISYPDPNLPSAPSMEDFTDDTQMPHHDLPQKPTIDRGTKPSSTATTDSFTKPGLRTVVTPSKVMSHFLTLSQKSTVNNIETCGILAGKLAQHQLIITHLILPKQQGTSDSCITMNEEEIFDYQDQHNLITIGWIHTHPTQTAFLSSVDLHTHCPYQVLMPEAIAIVCAPKYEETRFFILTPNYGLQYIANCKKSGFHPHPSDPPLFMNAEHIKVDGNAPLEVLDLRL